MSIVSESLPSVRDLAAAFDHYHDWEAQRILSEGVIAYAVRGYKRGPNYWMTGQALYRRGLTLTTTFHEDAQIKVLPTEIIDLTGVEPR